VYRFERITDLISFVVIGDVRDVSSKCAECFVVSKAVDWFRGVQFYCEVLCSAK